MAQRLDVRYVRYYTDGSAARKVETAEPFKTLKLPQKKTQKRRIIYIDPLAIAGIAMSVVMTVLMIVGAVHLAEARDDADRMARYVQDLKQENVELTTAYRTGYTLAEVEKAADDLGLVPIEEVTHIKLDIAAVPEAPVKIEKEEGFFTFLAGLFA